MVLAIEKADVIQGQHYQGDFFAMLRGWAERASKAHWSRLRLIVTISTEPSLLESIDHSSFFVLANPIRLDDLSVAQAAEMARLYCMEIVPSEITELVDLVGGSPYLLRLALCECVLGELSLRHQLDDLHRSIFIPHLVRLRGWLEGQELSSVVSQILEQTDAEIPFAKYCGLYAIGLVKEMRAGVYRLRCRLYEEYFGRSRPG